MSRRLPPYGRLRRLVYIAYMDESGSKDLKAAEKPWHVVAAVMMKDALFPEAVRRRNKIVGTLVPKKLQSDFEFHGKNLFRPSYPGNPIGFDNRCELIRRALKEIVVDLHSPVIYGGIHRERLRAQYLHPEPVNYLAFTFCAERVEQWFHQEHCLDDVGMFIADDTPDAKDPREAYRTYRSTGVALGRKNVKLSHLLDCMCFSDSRDSIGVQMADLCAYFTAGMLNRKPKCNEFYDIFRDSVYHRRIFPSKD